METPPKKAEIKDFIQKTETKWKIDSNSKIQEI